MLQNISTENYELFMLSKNEKEKRIKTQIFLWCISSTNSSIQITI